MDPESSPLLSVIIPCYNYAAYLPVSIGSVIEQTYSNLECIVVDDGSTDDSEEVVRQIAAKDPRVKYFKQKNSGPTVARNYGLKLAKGTFVAFLDADDMIQKKKLETQVAIFRQYPETDIVYGDVRYFTSNDISVVYDRMDLKPGPWMKRLSGKGDPMILELLEGNITETSAPLVRKELFEKLGNMNEELLYNEDWELWARFAIGNATFRFDDSKDTMVLRRVHDSYSNDVFKMYAYGLKVCLILSEKVHGRKYDRILVPKINYHKRIIDEKLMEILATNKQEAIAKALFLHSKTGLKRYLTYSKLFRIFPVWFCYLYSRFLFIIHKLKNVIVYA